MSCPLCGGTGETKVVVEHPDLKIKRVVSDPCLCMRSKYAQIQHKLLAPIQGRYRDPKKRDGRLEFIYPKINDSPNFLIKGNRSTWITFLLEIKALIMENMFRNPSPEIMFCRSIDILQNYFVPQSDGTTLHLSATDRYDLLVLVFGSKEKNDALKTCMSQIVHQRNGCRPTWIYMDVATLEHCKWEYSEELEDLTEGYKKITITEDVSDMSGPAESQLATSNFGGEV